MPVCFYFLTSLWITPHPPYIHHLLFSPIFLSTLRYLYTLFESLNCIKLTTSTFLKPSPIIHIYLLSIHHIYSSFSIHQIYPALSVHRIISTSPHPPATHSLGLFGYWRWNLLRPGLLIQFASNYGTKNRPNPSTMSYPVACL